MRLYTLSSKHVNHFSVTTLLWNLIPEINPLEHREAHHTRNSEPKVNLENQLKLK